MSLLVFSSDPGVVAENVSITMRSTSPYAFSARMSSLTSSTSSKFGACGITPGRAVMGACFSAAYA